MSAEVIKLFALICMLIDHIAAVLEITKSNLMSFKNIILGRTIGRFSLPIFAYFVVVGYTKTRNLKKYIGRMHLFAIISQIPFLLIFANDTKISRILTFRVYNFRYDLMVLPYILLILVAYWYFICEKKYDKSMIYVSIAYLILPIYTVDLMDNPIWKFNDLNIFYEFGISLIAIKMLENLFDYKKYSMMDSIFALISLVVSVYYMGAISNYGYKAITLVLLLFAVEKIENLPQIAKRIIHVVIISLWGFYTYSFYMPFKIAVLVSAAAVLIYNGKKGPSIKYLFYVFYPLHLFVIFLLRMIFI